MKIFVNTWIDQYIKENAKNTKTEIYGWLIGRETEQRDLIIQSALLCTRYSSQTLIEATPDPREIQEIARAIPNGLIICGIFHTHPGAVFHSHVDNQTLRNLSISYPNMISAVSNSKETKWFQILGGNIQEIRVELKPQDIHQYYLPVSYKLSYKWEISLEKPLIPQILRKFTDSYQDAYKESNILFLKGRPIPHENFTKNAPDQNKSTLFASSTEILRKASISEIDEKGIDNTIWQNGGLIVLNTQMRSRNPDASISDSILNNQIVIEGDIDYFSLFTLPNVRDFDPSRIREFLEGEFFQSMQYMIGRSTLLSNNTKNFTLITPKAEVLVFPDLPYLFYSPRSRDISLFQKAPALFVDALSKQQKTNFNSENFPSADWLKKRYEEDRDAIQKRIHSFSNIKPDYVKQLKKNLENIINQN